MGVRESDLGIIPRAGGKHFGSPRTTSDTPGNQLPTPPEPREALLEWVRLPDNLRKFHLRSAGLRASFVEGLFRPHGKYLNLGRIRMSGQVILYFDDQADALRFALAAGSVMAGDGTTATDDLVQETARVSRIRLDAANAGKLKKPTAECMA